MVYFNNEVNLLYLWLVYLVGLGSVLCVMFYVHLKYIMTLNTCILSASSFLL